MNRTRLDGTYPVARFDGLVVTESGNELLVFDTRTNVLHHLNPLASVVWRACDGFSDLRGIQAICSEKLVRLVSEQEVEDGLQKLADQDLMDGWPEPSGISGKRSSRRKLLKRTTVAGAAIASVTLPLASVHASSETPQCVPDFGNCSTASDCCRPQGGCNAPRPGAQGTCGG